MSKNRVSPIEHASKLSIGTIKTGNDDNKWIVSKRSTGIHFWKRVNSDFLLKTKIAGRVPKISKNYTKQIEPFKPKMMDGYHHISIGEIYNSNICNTIKIKVTPTFYKELQKKPKYYLSKPDKNAYIFGVKYKKSDYIKVCSHVNDGAQTGIIDSTNITPVELNAIIRSKSWMEIFLPPKKLSYNWDVREKLKEVQNKISNRILFLGATYGGDVGADIYIHFGKNKEIDSLIIDNQYIFENE